MEVQRRARGLGGPLETLASRRHHWPASHRGRLRPENRL